MIVPRGRLVHVGLPAFMGGKFLCCINKNPLSDRTLRGFLFIWSLQSKSDHQHTSSLYHATPQIEWVSKCVQLHVLHSRDASPWLLLRVASSGSRNGRIDIANATRDHNCYDPRCPVGPVRLAMPMTSNYPTSGKCMLAWLECCASSDMKAST